MMVRVRIALSVVMLGCGGSAGQLPAYFTGGIELPRGAALIAATMTMGLVAAVFALYANTIMSGLRRRTTRPSSAHSRRSTGRVINP